MLRRIKTASDLKAVQRRNKIILGVVMIFLLGAAPLGYSLLGGGHVGNVGGGNNEGAQGSSLQENGYEFFYVDGLWRFDINGQVYALTYLPSEVSDIEVEGTYSINDYSSKTIYFVDGDDMISEVLSNLGRYASRYQEACVGNETCAGDFPVKTCSDSLIIHKTGNETRVYKEGGCVYIVGDPIKGADAFIYKVLKVN